MAATTRLVSFLVIVLAHHAAAGESAADPVDSPRLGVPPSAEQLARHDRFIAIDGDGLPPGEGSAAAGEAIFQRLCVGCHGPGGRGGTGGELSGGHPDLTRSHPDQNVGTYWPFATTLFDFIRRAMPMSAPGSLTDDEVYALCAYILALNGIVSSDAQLDAASLAAIRMPNRLGFDPVDADWRPPP